MPKSKISWTPERIKRAIDVLKETADIYVAAEKLSTLFDSPVTRGSLYNTLRDHGHNATQIVNDVIKQRLSVNFAQRATDSNDNADEKVKQLVSDKIQKLVSLTKKAPMGFFDLCDKLDMSPSRMRFLIKECEKRNIAIKINDDKVGLNPAAEEARVHTVIAPAGKRQKIAVISDIHFGSKYILRPQLKDFINYAYDQGVREIVCPGDILDGCYRHGKWELTHHGIEEQAQDAFETLPKKPGLTYHGITGNHDFTFTEENGVEVGPFLVNYFKERKRNDLHMYGNRGAFLKLRGAIVHLWHPRSGVSYARSYALQKHIEKYSSGEKPHILLAGHWHVYCHVYERGVHALACPTFQGGGSAFSKSLGGAPAIGGMLLEWDLTEHGTMRTFKHEYRTYFEVEKPHQIFNESEFLQKVK